MDKGKEVKIESAGEDNTELDVDEDRKVCLFS